ncbi:MAG: DUF1330 domain-containing protein [Pseudomonadota bacterium]
MPKGYWIAHADVQDMEAWQRYVAAARAAFEAHGATFLARGGAHEEAEDPQGRSRHVVCEFPSLEAAQACYHSETYQEARKHRDGSGIVSITLVEGLA